jgi:hypothetical protein
MNEQLISYIAPSAPATRRPATGSEPFVRPEIGFTPAFDSIGIHNCAWTADPYLEHYASIPNLGYIDMGINSDLRRARELMPETRRALMYTPIDLAAKSEDDICADFERIARDYAPCDIVIADIEAGTPDERVQFALDLCSTLSKQRKA